MASESIPSLCGRLIWAGLLCATCGVSRAQTATNPLLGAWTGGAADGTTSGTDVYGPDGTLVSTARVSVGANTMLVRVFARYQARQVGPNQMQVDAQVVGYLPHQVCAVSPAGTDCRPFPMPDLPTSMAVTFLDANTIQANGTVSYRDQAPALGQVQVPEVAMVQAQAPVPTQGTYSTCTLGSTVCDPSGWRKYCERWPDGHADYMQHGVRCRNGYNQPEF